MRSVAMTRTLLVAALAALVGVVQAGLIDGTVLINRAANNRTITVNYEGVTAALVEMRVNGESVSSRAVDDKSTVGETNFALNPAILVDGDNTIEIRLYDAEGLFGVGREQAVVDQDIRLAAQESYFPAQKRILFDSPAALQRRLENRPKLVAVGTLEGLLSPIVESQAVVCIVEADIGFMSHEHDPRAFGDMAVIGDVIIGAIRRLDPRIENLNKGYQRNAAGIRHKQLYIDPLKIHGPGHPSPAGAV